MRYASPSGPMCLLCLLLTLSGPVELLFLLCFIAAWTSVVVSVMLVDCGLSVFLSMCDCLFVLCVLCLTVLVNCLLNAFSISVGEVNVLSLKVIVSFLGCVGFMFANPSRVLSSKEYVYCVCNPCVCLGIPSICQICVFVYYVRCVCLYKVPHHLHLR